MEEMTKIDYTVQQNTNTHMFAVTRKRIKEVKKKNNKMMKKTTIKYSENISSSKIYIIMMMQK